MVDFGLKRNGSGYYDETPYKAVMDMPKPGEVWATTQDKLFLVLKNHGKFCTTLSLNETNRDNECLGVMVEYTMYTNPAMLGYTFNQNFCECIKKIPDEQLLDIRNEVGARLGVTIYTVVQPEKDETQAQLIQQLENDNRQMSLEIDKLKESERMAETEMKVYKKLANEYASLFGEPAAEAYKVMYYELLDRIISRGAAV